MSEQVRLRPCIDTRLTCSPPSKVLGAAQLDQKYGGDGLNHILHEGNAVTPFVLMDQEQGCLETYLEKAYKGGSYRGRFELI